MKKLMLIFFLIFFTQEIYASHIIGADLEYQCIGNGQYEITYTFYRDCYGIDAPQTFVCNIENACGFPAMSVTLNRITVTPTQLVPSCGLVTLCDGGTAPGIQKWLYTGIAILPAECYSWNLSVSESARSAAISVSQNPDFYNLFVIANINNTNNLCDTSPVFNNDPIFFACVNQPYCLDPGIFDAEGDSISCSLIDPLDNASQIIPYKSGYSATQPLQSTPPVELNESSGTLCFTPTQADVSVYAILVSSYRNGELIGQVERDMILYLTNCTNSQPDLTGINGSGNFDLTVCANDPACFNIYSTDPTSSDSTTITWGQEIAGASFTTTSSQNESGYFCWTPGLNDISTTPHCFSVNVSDNDCPARQNNVKQYCITVVDSVTCATLPANNISNIAEELKIYPQPAKDHFIVECGLNSIGKNLTYRIDDAMGKRVFQNKITERFTEIRGLKSGIYVGYLMDDRGSVLEKGKIVVM